VKKQSTYLLFCWIIILLSYISSAQTIKVTGKVTDSLKQPLEYANVFAVPIDKNNSISYAITNLKGAYILKLQKNKAYKVTTSFLGYVKQEVLFKFSKDTIYNFSLKEDKNQLDEVTLTYKIPIKVKEDTITYNADSFKTGEERKLKDVLKKLPGIEVDRKGNVTANGKKIKKLLVEDKPFFGGNTKLGVNNIPADAIDKVQVLENYNDVALLKGLQDSDESVLNVKLKKDKKKFVFGDLELGAGVKKRYLLHPKLFYYSPKTSVNFIGDSNNQGVKSFTFKDYLEFEGGLGKLMSSPKEYFGLYNSDFAKYLNNQDYLAEKNNFGAFSVRHSITKATDLSAYTISSLSTTNTQNNNENIYLNENNSFLENRTTKNKIDNFFTIAKIILDYDPNKKTDYAFASFIKLTKAKNQGNVTTISDFSDNYINTKSDNKAVNIKQSVSLNKSASDKHTITLNADYTYKKNQPEKEWQTNQELLQGIIPLQQATEYQIFNHTKLQSNLLKIEAKDYWILHRFHHIYTSIGTYASDSKLFNINGQILDNQQVNDFNNANFNNDFRYSFLDTYLGLEYKFKIDKANFKPAIFYHRYDWSTKQFNEKDNFSKNLFLPQFSCKINFRSSEKLFFKYALNARFQSINSLANRYSLTNFNSVFKGNNQLENTLYHKYNLRYYKFNLFRGYQFNIGLNYFQKIKTIKNEVVLVGINQYRTKIIFDKPENQWSFNTSFSKRINKIRYRFAFNTTKTKYYQIVNSTISKTNTISYNLAPSIKTFFKKMPNIELGYKLTNNQYQSTINTDNQYQEIYAFLDYDFLKNFIFNADFSYHKNEDNNNNRNHYLASNAKLFYQKEDSPWGFELQTTNIFNAKFKQNNTFNDFIISDTKTYILPRIVMFKIVYKL